MIDRNSCLDNLSVGDIFHAEYPNGASCICLVLAVEKTTLHARRVTTQQNISFNRRTGIEENAPDQPQAVIDSVAPLPLEIHHTFLGLDRRYKDLMAMDEASRFRDLEPHKLTEAEKKALRFVDTYYASNPLPPAET
jgi:hypothetical protein